MLVLKNWLFMVDGTPVFLRLVVSTVIITFLMAMVTVLVMMLLLVLVLVGCLLIMKTSEGGM